VRRLVRDLNTLYRNRPALHARDCEAEGFRWIVADDAENSVFAWERHAPGERPIAVISNMTPIPRYNYDLRLSRGGTWREILNSDSALYGGSDIGNGGSISAADDGCASVTLPPLSTLLIEAA